MRRPFSTILEVTLTTGLASRELLGEYVSGEVFAYTVRASAATNANMDFYLVDRLADSGDDDTPAANAAAEYRVVDDTTNTPDVSATEKFMGSVLAYPMPFKNGLRVYFNTTGGAGGTYIVEVRGWTGDAA
jgi:hypothetical protein